VIEWQLQRNLSGNKLLDLLL